MLQQQKKNCSWWRMHAVLPRGGFPINAPKGCCLKECRFLLGKKKRERKRTWAQQRPACTPTHNLLRHDAPVTTFLQEIIHHTDTLRGTALLCGNYCQDKLTLGTYKVSKHLFILWKNCEGRKINSLRKKLIDVFMEYRGSWRRRVLIHSAPCYSTVKFIRRRFKMFARV